MCLLAMTLRVDLLFAYVLGYAYTWKLSTWLQPSDARIALWEAPGGWLARTRITSASCYVPSTSALLPTPGAMGGTDAGQPAAG
ncbi:MAG: hypothetical protein EOO41_02880, partial [Methanobacteriota archaeon]